jgi:2-dehydropantoate 2-reductase
LASGPRIAVFGAGSVGCFIGGSWLAAGCRVAFVGRERVRAEIAEHGMGLSDQDGWRIHLASDLISFSTTPAALKTAEIIALCVKSTGTVTAAKEIARHAKPGATVVSFQNGVSNADTLRSMLPKFTIVQAMVPYNVVHLGHGRWHRATWGDLTAGRSEATRALSERIGDRPGRLRLSDDMKGVLWGKLLFNLNNAINALSGRTILDELGHRDYRRVMAAAVMETLSLLDAAGIEPAKIGQIAPRLLPHAIGAPDFVFRNLFLRIQKIDPKARSSMSDDFAAGRQTEIDFLNGEVVKLAKALGREAPVNAAIVELVKQAEAGIEHVWSPGELRAYVLEGHRGAVGFGY